jgi:hypothetical protein
MNYRKTILALIFTLLVTTGFSQNRHWTFAKMFGGMPEANLPENNIPYHMDLDSEGNVYIYGTAGQLARIDTTYLGTVGTDNTRGSFLAKFNCRGELLWHKSVKCEQYDISANWMQIKNDTVYILTEFHIGLTENAYFIDSTILSNQITYPYSFPYIPLSHYNVLVTFDKNGNNIRTNYFQSANRRFMYWAESVPFTFDNP